MKTITLQGTEEQIKEALIPLSLLPVNQIGFMKTAIRSNLNKLQVETIVYVIPILLEYDEEDLKDISDEEFMAYTEKDGRIFSLEDFQKAFALNEVTPFVDIIRFITVKI